MAVLIETLRTAHTPESLGRLLAPEPGRTVLRSTGQASPWSRWSFVTARPFLTFQCHGSNCETVVPGGVTERQFGNPWKLLAPWLERFEIDEEHSLPLPLGGAFGYFGYELNQFTTPRIARRAVNDLELPDAHLGFHSSLVAFDSSTGLAHVIATGLDAAGNRSSLRAERELRQWIELLKEPVPPAPVPASPPPSSAPVDPPLHSSLPGPFFTAAVRRAQGWIQTGDIYQVNLSQRLDVPIRSSAWELFESLLTTSPAPFAAFLDTGVFGLVSASPELFLRIAGDHVITRPIKGTRPRGQTADADARLAAELMASEKERAELLMITDLLRNDLGRIARFGSVRVPDLLRLESFAQVHHLVSTVEGRLREGLSHLDVLEACFPGGSITGAPKIRAMQIIDELEPVARGPYCGCHGYLGFNRHSQLAITIRSAVVRDSRAWFHAGAGIVADSDPEAELAETHAKARGLISALGMTPSPMPSSVVP
jgi:para-aminobenzoate synthetase component 1